MSAERRPPTATELLPVTDVSGPGEHPQRPVDPFREQLDSHPRELPRPGQSGFFRPEAQSGRYSLRDVPIEEVVVRRTSATPTERRATPVPAAHGRSDLSARNTPASKELQTEREANPQPPSDQLEIPPVLTSAARRWRATGVFNVAPSASSTHGKALERATLIALMQDSPLSTWPEAVVLRARWLFRDGWESGQSELDSCLAVLDLPSDAGTEASLRAFIARHLPPLSG